MFLSLVRFEEIDATVAFLDCIDPALFIVRVPAALAALRTLLSSAAKARGGRDDAPARADHRVAVVVQARRSRFFSFRSPPPCGRRRVCHESGGVKKGVRARGGRPRQAGAHYNSLESGGADLFSDFQLFAAQPEVARLLVAERSRHHSHDSATPSPPPLSHRRARDDASGATEATEATEAAPRWSVRVLEATPTHWRTATGLYEAGEAKDGGARPCAPMPTEDRTLYDLGPADGAAAGTSEAPLDVARLRANYRNRAIEAALNAASATNGSNSGGGSLKMLRVWRALVPAWQLHRSPADCTHLGFDALVFVAQVFHAFLVGAPEWRAAAAS